MTQYDLKFGLYPGKLIGSYTFDPFLSCLTGCRKPLSTAQLRNHSFGGLPVWFLTLVLVAQAIKTVATLLDVDKRGLLNVRQQVNAGAFIQICRTLRSDSTILVDFQSLLFIKSIIFCAVRVLPFDFHRLVIFNAPDRIPLEHTKTAILTACGMQDTMCTARRLRKSKPSMCCPIIMRFRDEKNAARLLTAQTLLSST
ncbi:hypothetical protein CLF_112910 [Clonorchis sinensis]|uniref:Uncharacterized protein n=1 Tax=Clonorchis sinensis TaxID=79923 RepID=G7YX92_CLOSI|nr:hypothetical protein CLF_112910 [Clonorchis sinensis]